MTASGLRRRGPADGAGAACVKPKLESMRIVNYPDPVLRKPCAPVEKFDDSLRAIAARMIELMRAAKGVGLAAPQVGVPIRLFVMNTTDDPAQDRILVNPVISEHEGSVEADEGCLSIPGISVKIRRAARCRLTAQDVFGQPISLEGGDLPARVWQHETDHLNGVLIIDKMGPTDRIATRKTLRALEDGHGGRERGT